jgi:hypothetical protein
MKVEIITPTPVDPNGRGMVRGTRVLIDGKPVPLVRSVSFRADIEERVPVVTLELLPSEVIISGNSKIVAITEVKRGRD